MNKKTLTTTVCTIFSIIGLTTLLLPIPVLAEDCTNTVYSGKLSANVQIANGYADISNHTATCSYQVGVASYKMFVAPKDWNDPHGSSPDLQWLYSQELFNHSEQSVGPNQTVRLYFRVPDCAYQFDTFQGPLIAKIMAGGEDYDDQGVTRAILSNISQRPFGNENNLCQVPTPTPSPTPKPSPSPTYIPTPTATPFPTPYPTCDSRTAGTYVNGVYCPVITPVMTPTPTPTPTPTGQVLGATPTPTPPPSLPMTGPEVTALLPLLGVVGGLLGKKYFHGH